MHCPKCDTDNPAGNNFCGRCGSALVGLCTKCGAENQPTSNFCGKCGASLSAPISDLGVAYILIGRYVEAIPIFKAYFVSYPNVMWAHVWQAIAYGELGRWEEARGEAAEIMRLSPNFSLKAEKERMALQDQTLEERYLNDLRKAGLK